MFEQITQRWYGFCIVLAESLETSILFYIDSILCYTPSPLQIQRDPALLLNTLFQFDILLARLSSGGVIFPQKLVE